MVNNWLAVVENSQTVKVADYWLANLIVLALLAVAVYKLLICLFIFVFNQTFSSYCHRFVCVFFFASVMGGPSKRTRSTLRQSQTTSTNYQLLTKVAAVQLVYLRLRLLLSVQFSISASRPLVFFFYTLQFLLILLKKARIRAKLCCCVAHLVLEYLCNSAFTR